MIVRNESQGTRNGNIYDTWTDLISPYWGVHLSPRLVGRTSKQLASQGHEDKRLPVLRALMLTPPSAMFRIFDPSPDNIVSDGPALYHICQDPFTTY